MMIMVGWLMMLVDYVRWLMMSVAHGGVGGGDGCARHFARHTAGTGVFAARVLSRSS